MPAPLPLRHDDRKRKTGCGLLSFLLLLPAPAGSRVKEGDTCPEEQQQSSSPPQQHGGCGLRRVSAASLSPSSFDRGYREAAPVIITGAAAGWPAALEEGGWGSRSAFTAKFGAFSLPLRAAKDLANRGSGYSATKMTIQDYADGNATENSLFSNVEEPVMALLRQGFVTPRVLDGVSYDTIASVGHGGSGVPFHRHSESWLATFGAKRWFLLPPSEPNPPILKPCAYSLSRLAPSAVSCVQQSGEILFIPSGWWHATCNLEEFVVGVGGQGLAGLGSPLPALHRAALHGSVAALEAAALLSEEEEGDDHISGAAGDVQLWHNQLQPMHLAAKNGHLSAVQWLHAHGASLEGARDEQLFTPLHWAVQRKQLAVVEWLLGLEYDGEPRVLDIERQDSLGFRPIQYSCYVGGLEILQLLLARGANPRPSGSHACVDLAQAQGHTEVATFAEAL